MTKKITAEKEKSDEMLDQLLREKDPNKIKKYLQELPMNTKGAAFEEFLSKLYRGLGYLTGVNGGRDDGGADILVYHPDTPGEVTFMIQAKNKNVPLTKRATNEEIHYMENNACDKHNCRSFQIISVSGFARDANIYKKYCEFLSWLDVTKLIDDYDPNRKKPVIIPLAARNITTYSKMKNLFKKNNRVAACQATGTGKSHLIAKLISDNITKKALVLAPSIYILHRLQEKFHWVFERKKLRTYQSLEQMTPNEIKNHKYDIIVLDEFHRVGAAAWGRAVEQLLKANPKSKIFGTSATPVRYLDAMRDMTAEIFQDNKASNITLAEAIATKTLPCPTYIAALYTLDKVILDIKNTLTHSALQTANKVELTQKLATIEKSAGIPQILINHLTIENNKIIIFCQDQNHLDEMQALVPTWFQQAFPGRERQTYGVWSGNAKNTINLDAFRSANNANHIHLLFCVDMLNEGLHFNDVGAVILLRPTISPIVFFQQIGRCLEINPRHQPVIFDLVNNFENIRSNDFIQSIESAITKENESRKKDGLDPSKITLKLEDYTKDVFNLLSDITVQLHSWEIMFQQLEEFKTVAGHCVVPDAYDLNPALGTWVQKQRSNKVRLPDDKVKRLNSIGFVWDPLNDQWEARFSELEKYKKKHKDCNVPASFKENRLLANWVQTQRANLNNIEKDRFKKLNQLGFIWDRYDDVWQSRYLELKEFEKVTKHCNVPSIYPKNQELANWVSRQRAAQQTLSNEKLTKLQQIGFNFDVRSSQWEEMYKLLVAFQKKNKHCDVPQRSKEKNGLGVWVAAQRTNFDRLDKEKKALLNKIKFDWNPKLTRWTTKLNELKEFKKQKKHCNVPQNYAKNKQLGVWVNSQRRNKENLQIDQVKQLNALGFEWNPMAAAWKKMFSKLVEFKRVNGHCIVKKKDDPQLSAWVSRQRRDSDILEKTKKQKLDDIKFEWQPHSKQWDEKFSELIKFKKQHKHCNVTATDRNCRQLASWVDGQRQNWRKKTLSRERIGRLNEIGFRWSV